MKTQGIKTLYRLFAYLSDHTNGFRPFVHYKLMLGALLISLTANACKGKQTSKDNKKSDTHCVEATLTEYDDPMAEEPLLSTTMCYFIAPEMPDIEGEFDTLLQDSIEIEIGLSEVLTGIVMETEIEEERVYDSSDTNTNNKSIENDETNRH